MMENNKQLSNITALVTGGSRGVGRGLALGLGEYGATVYITGRNIADLEETAVSVAKLGGVCIPLVCDHNNDAETKAVFEKIIVNVSVPGLLSRFKSLPSPWGKLKSCPWTTLLLVTPVSGNGFVVRNAVD